MPNTYARIATTYKAEDIQRADLKVHFEIEEGLDELAEYRGEDRLLLGEVGMYEGNRKATRRGIVLKGWVRGDTNSDYRTWLQWVQALFLPSAPGDLVATLENGGTATIRARTEAIVPIGDLVSNAREFRIVMRSIAPNWTIT